MIFLNKQYKYVSRKEPFGNYIMDLKTHDYKFLTKGDNEKFKSDNKKIISTGLSEKNWCTKIKGLQAPLKIFLEVTNRCNLSCTHCYNQPDLSSNLDMKEELWTDIINQCKKVGVFEYRITGGEPTLFPDLFNLLKKIPNFSRVVLNSNGIINKSILYKLFDSHISLFNISLDGPIEVHELKRGIGNFSRVIDTIEQLIYNRKNLRVNMVVGKSNKDYVADLVKICDSIGVEYISFNILHPFGRANYIDTINRKENKKLVENIVALKKKYKHIHMTTPWLFIYEKNIPFYFTCGFSGITITTDGYMYICGQNKYFEKSDYYSLVDTEILSFWRKIQQDSFLTDCFNNKKCKLCQYSMRCPGRCPMLSKEIFGDFKAEDPLCII